MTIHKINRSISFLQSSQLNYVVLKVLLFLYKSLCTTAQEPGTGTTSLWSQPPSSDPYSLGQKFNPTTAVVMVILVSVFFFIGFFSVYVRRFHSVHFDPAVVRGEGRRSWRGYDGLEAEVIETFPTFLYSAVKRIKIGKATLACAVCLNEFEDEQTLRLIPKCSHVFHPDCIDAWLNTHVTCPVCRANLVPKPGDLPLAPGHVPDPDQNLVEPDNQINVNEEAQINQVQIHTGDDDDQITGEVPQQTMRSPNMNFLSPTNGPHRSWSTNWRLRALFSRSNSTGHSLIQSGDNYERFTLRLPENVRSQLMNIKLNRTKSCVTFSRVRSPRKGYRSRSGGAGRRGRTFLFYERFDQEGRPEQWGFTMTPPFIYRGSPSRSSKEMTGCDHEANATPPKNLLWSVRSIKSPLHRMFLRIDNSNRDNSNNNNNNNHNVGERSFDRLRPADSQV